MHRVSAQQAPQDQTQGQLIINETVVPHYSIFDPNEFSQVNVGLEYEFLPQNDNVTLSLLSEFKPTNITALAVLADGTVTQFQFSVTPGEYSAFNGYSATLPTKTVNASIFIQGYQSGESLLFRYVTAVPFLRVSGAGLPPTPTVVNVIAPAHTIISQAYGAGESPAVAGPDLPAPHSTTSGAPSGSVIYVLTNTQVVDIVTQSYLYTPVSIVITAIGAISLILASIGFFQRGRKFLGIISTRTKKYYGYLTAKIFAILQMSMHIKTSAVSVKSFRSLLVPKTLLVIFITCSFAMVSIAAITGPGPTARVYVLAPLSELPSIQHGLENSIGSVELVNPSQDYNDMNVMSSIGEFKMIVITAYPAATLPDIEANILPQLGNIPVIVVDHSVNPTFAREISALYPNQVTNVTDITNLLQNESERQEIGSAFSQSATNNFFGVNISDSGYTHILEIEAALSFLLVFSGWLYLGAKVVEPGVETSLSRIGSVILSGVFVFVFSEVVYVVTSATLAFPLSLHAVISGAQSITATGLMGRALHLPLGGGSTPRLLAGLLGLLVGALLVGGEKMFSLRSLSFMVGIFILLILNPFVIGKVVFQGLFLFMGNISLGTAYASSLTIKGFFYGIGSILGGSVTPVYLMSAGKMVYFAGLVPLAFIKRMGKNTATFTLLLAAVLVGDGGVRVGEMTPDKTVIAILPGLIGGMTISLILLLVSGIEKYLTSSYAKSRP